MTRFTSSSSGYRWQNCYRIRLRGALKPIFYLLLMGTGNIVLATEAPLPTAQEIIDAQMRCDSKKIAAIPWISIPGVKGPYIKLADRILAIVRNLEISEYEPQLLKGKIKLRMRGYRVQYQKIGLLRCAEKLEKPDPGVPTKVNESFIIVEDQVKPQRISLATDDKDNERPWISYLQGRDGADDEPAPKGRDGLPCLADIDELAKNPKVVQIEKLCVGEKASAKAFTRNEIRKLTKKFNKN